MPTKIGRGIADVKSCLCDFLFQHITTDYLQIVPHVVLKLFCKTDLKTDFCLTDIVANSDHSHLERIVKSNPTSLANLEQQVLTTEDDTQPQELVRFLMVKYSPTETSTGMSYSFSFFYEFNTRSECV